jgi:hypothetical protein
MVERTAVAKMEQLNFMVQKTPLLQAYSLVGEDSGRAEKRNTAQPGIELRMYIRKSNK